MFRPSGRSPPGGSGGDRPACRWNAGGARACLCRRGGCPNQRGPKPAGQAETALPTKPPPHSATRVARPKLVRAFEQIVAEELMDAFNNQGDAINREEDAHRMAEASRVCTHSARY